MTVAEFFEHAPAPLSGNDAWSQGYADELRRVIVNTAENAPRQRQVALGPSELGVACDRQVVGKLAQVPATNHVGDPWASIVGTALHAWLADTFAAENRRLGYVRWLTETRVHPAPDVSGTADLYDVETQTVTDFKALGPTTLPKLARHGPSEQYHAQVLLYAHGFQRAGLPVQRVSICALPRTESRLDGMYVWSERLSEETDALVTDVLSKTHLRRALATLVMSGALTLNAVPKTPTEDTCVWCPFYSPEAAYGVERGCSGPRHNKEG